VDVESLNREEFSATLDIYGFKLRSKAAIGDYSPFRKSITTLAGLLQGHDLNEEHDFSGMTGGGWTIVDPRNKLVKLYKFALVDGTERTCRIIVLRYKPALGAGAAGAAEDVALFADTFDDPEYHEKAHMAGRPQDFSEDY